MKKFILILLMTSILFMVSMSIEVKAEIVISQETKNYVPGDATMTINGVDPNAANYSGSGYVTLLMGLGNAFSFDVDAMLADMIYYADNLANIDDMYIIITLGEYYTSAPDPYWNWNPTSDPEISAISPASVLKFQLDPENVASTASFTIWWANTGTSGGAPYNDTGGVRWYSAQLVVEYTVPISPVIDVNGTYASLPESDGIFLNVEEASLYDEPTNSYHFIISYYNEVTELIEYYQFDVAVPEDIDMDAVIWENGLVNASYTTFEGDRILYLQPDPDELPAPMIAGTVTDAESLLPGFCAINLTQGESQITRQLKLQNIVHYERISGNAYSYVFMPATVDDMYAISMRYYYRISFLGFPGEWMAEYSVYYQDETHEVKPSWLFWLLGPVYLILDGLDVFNVSAIVETTSQDVPDVVKTRYVDEYGGSVFDFQTASIYKVHLGQFINNPFNSYEIQDIAVMYCLYSAEGEVLEAYFPEILQTNILPTPPYTVENLGLPDILSSLTSSVGSIFAIAGTAILLLGGGYLFISYKNRKRYQRS